MTDAELDDIETDALWCARSVGMPGCLARKRAEATARLVKEFRDLQAYQQRTRQHLEEEVEARESTAATYSVGARELRRENLALRDLLKRARPQHPPDCGVPRGEPCSCGLLDVERRLAEYTVPVTVEEP